MAVELDVIIDDWSKVLKQCKGSNTETIEEFSERLSEDFWRAPPIQTDSGTVRFLQIGPFVEDDTGLSHILNNEEYGFITLKINKELESKKVEKL